MEKTQLTVYTIGHSNLKTSKFITLLKNNQINILVDVRSTPYSQYNPQFNKDSLKNSIEGAGLQYEYMGDLLGGRPGDPSCYIAGVIPDGEADYLHLVDYPAVMTKKFFQKGIRALLKLAEKNKVAIMCSEEDPSTCHRHHLIGRYLVEKENVNVVHIRKDGQLPNYTQFKNTISPNTPAEQTSLF